ncbi:nitroreductase [Sulfuricurvum sp.]|uniref:nitroreductase n=1 Tax=Sulfuricurvum sp. TaxID=2025608 RepID=UPI002626E62B|nr:nitroreductase [Sulfuricurvum sp.]MDD4885119.1 nitroreductase [Sulfuricurvum sp.]
MNVFEALKSRKSVRAFLSKAVEKEKIEMILNSAKHAPSGVNMQPWKVCVVSGKTKNDIETKIIDAFESGIKPNMDYRYYPLEWNEPYKSRRKETGLLMYQTLKIAKEDKEKQQEQWKANYRAFDAPVVLYFFIESSLEKGSWLDYGMFLQSVMLSAAQLGLGSCTQAALAEYPDIVRKELNIKEEQILLCGMALGYEDTNAIINSYRTERIDVEKFTQFYG